MELIFAAIAKGAKFYASISGGKDGQAMVKVLLTNGIPITACIHADLGRVEWHQSLAMCKRSAKEAGTPLIVVKRRDGRDLIDHWKDRMKKLQFTACDIKTKKEIIVSQAPFWSSSESRYCTSDLKRGPINNYLVTQGTGILISCEGIRAAESKARQKKKPLTIRAGVTSSFYKGMTVEDAIKNYQPGKRLVLNWYPIFNASTKEVWDTYNMSPAHLITARHIYKTKNKVVEWWPFHPAYVFGNERVSCVFCVLGCINDLQVGASQRPELLQTMIQMEDEGQATFKNGFSLKQLV